MKDSVRTVVYILGSVLLILVVGIIVLATLERTIPDVLVNLAFADLAGLTGILVKTGEAAEIPNNRRGLPEVGEG